MKRKLFKPCLYAVLILLFSVAASIANDSLPKVSYDRVKDMLSVDAKDHSLTTILSMLVIKTGVDITIDPSIERKVTARFKGKKLEKGIKALTRGLSLALIYETVDGKEDDVLLIGVKIFPGGKEERGELVKVLGIKHETVFRAKLPPRPRDGVDAPDVSGLAEKRWAARLKNMSEKRRESVLASIKERQDRQLKKREERDQRRKDRQERKEKRDQKRRAEDEALKESNPGLYELRKQQKEDARERTMEKYRNNQGSSE